MPEARTRNVVVVGGSSSIGVKVVEAFLAAGDRVLSTSRSGAESVPSAAKAVRLDVADGESRRAFAAEVASLAGGVDVLLLLPSVLPGRKLTDYDDRLMDEVMSVNFTHQARLLKAVLPSFASDALLMLMASISGERGSYDPIYAASKGAMIAFGKSLASWLAPGVRTVILSPALIEGSRMWQDMTPERREHHRLASPMKRLMDCEELARTIVDLSRPHLRALNGAVVRLNGGAYV